MHVIEEQSHADTLLAAQKQSLELVVTGAPLQAVLGRLTMTVDELSQGSATASILLLGADGRLRNGSSPSLPFHYIQAIDGLPADPTLGTCCAAAALGRVVVTPDFETAPGWSGLAHLPIGIGYRGAWSMPILARDGAVLGTFGTYFRECREPTPHEREVVEVLARTAAIAIERDRGEQALRERDAFNRRLLDSTADCIEVLDWDGSLLSMNRAGAELMEIDDVGLVIGRDYLDFWADADRVAAEAALARARNGMEGRFEGSCPTLGGSPRWWDVLITPILDGFGKPHRFLVVARDITDRHRTQEDLRRAKEEAESASLAKSQFLAVMSHELRTPLTGMIGYADLLLTGVGGSLPEQQLAHVARIKTGAWHLVAIIDEILTFSRMDAGKESVVLAPSNVTALVRESTELLQPHAQTRGLELRFLASDADIETHTDAGKLRQIILNLTGNALKFTDAGVVELEVAAAGDDVLVRVSDTGPGIAAENLETIFEPFVQIDQSSTRAQGGTGLGLSVCRSLAALLGGDITVQSVLGEGTTFVLRLPLRRGD